MPEKQLELSRRNAFFTDPFFTDLRAGLGGDLERRLAEVSARSMGLAGAGLSEAAHNIQVSASNDKFQVQLELPGFSPEDFSLKTKDDIVIVEAVHESTEDGSSGSRRFTREFKMPAGVVREKLSSTYSGKGILTVSAPRVLTAPDGAEISEAMKAQSQAYVTDDGTAVKKDEKASSQSIAATTQSPDGSTTSSFKSSSSSSSSSTMMSSGGPMPGGGGSMMPMMGGGGMGGMPSLDMDGMMSKMMSGMGSMDMSSGLSKSAFSSSSSSSFSSSSSSSMMSSGSMLGGMGGMPPMRGMEMPGLSFEEMSSMPPTASTTGEKPEYTVTSPPMSPPPPEEMNHKVYQTEDYVPPTTQTAEATVLLKVKEGNEYKLALNMQQFTPDDITIKLNGNELTIEAKNGGESSTQKHMIPENIDLDAMSSSFSSDGVLVIKAPKK
jgi:HSP20 family molecular chaperone IbpA